MTGIAIWPSYIDSEHPRIWASGDSLISQLGGSPLIQDGAKIFSLPVVCRSVGKDGLFSEPYFAHTLGYCFAGSTLMGQNSFLSAAPLLTTLTSEEEYIPSMEDVAMYLQYFMRSSYDYYKVIAQVGAQFEAAIFGWCHNAKALQAWHFKPSDASGAWEIILEKVDFCESGGFLYLGDHKNHVKEELANAVLLCADNEQEPRKVIQDLIKSESYSSIGGDEQLAIANEFGLQPYQLARSTESGSPPTKFSHLGIELTDHIAWVGRARVGGPAIT
jgi:hypothetical protein